MRLRAALLLGSGGDRCAGSRRADVGALVAFGWRAAVAFVLLGFDRCRGARLRRSAVGRLVALRWRAAVVFVLLGFERCRGARLRRSALGRLVAFGWRAAVASLVFVLSVGCDVSQPVRHRPDAGPCPHLLAGENTPLADFSCASSLCTAQAAQAGCAISVEISGCASLSLRGTVNVDRSISWDDRACESIEAWPDGLISLRCPVGQEQCRLDLYPSTEGTYYSVEPLRLFEGAPLAVPEDHEHPLRPVLAARRGYISATVRRGDVTIVVTYDGRIDGLDCTSPLPTRTFFIDTASFAILRTATTAPCLNHLVEGERGNLYGVFGGSEPHVGRFTESLVLTASTAIPLAFGIRYALDVAQPQNGLIYVLMGTGLPEVGQGSLVIFDPDTLRVMLPVELFNGPPTSLAFTVDVEAAIATRDGRIRVFPDMTGVIRDIRLFEPRGLSDRGGFLRRHGRSGFLVLTTTGDNPGVLVVDSQLIAPRPVHGAAFDYERGGELWALDPLGDGSDLMLASIVEPESGAYRARVMRFDPLNVRFLPGSVHIGTGVVTHMQSSPEHPETVIAVMPWSGELVRLSVE